jgi:large subunit ribosomal protein L1
MTKHGKKYEAAQAKVDPDKEYSPRDAVTLAKETSITKFDSTVEVHMRTALDPRQADQQVRDVVVLPHGLGKTVRVLVFAQGEGAAAARSAGAGLMPNPKAGTVVTADNIARAIKEAKAGRVEFRLDKTANIHVSVGKVSFDANQLYENFAALMDAVHKARPAGAKGDYIKRITLTTTMGPGIKVNPSETHNFEGIE